MTAHSNRLAKTYEHHGRVWYVYASFKSGEAATEEWLDLLASGEIDGDSIVRSHASRWCILLPV